MGITDRGGAEANNRFWFHLRLARRTELHGCDGRCSCWHCIGCGYCRGGCVFRNGRGDCVTARGREWMGQYVGAERGLSVRAMFARFRMGRWFTGERGRGPRVVALRRASQVFFLLLFLFLLLRTEFRGTVGAGGDVRLHWPVRLFFELDPLAALCERAGDPCALSRAAVELNHSAAGDVSGAVLLRMDLPDGNAAPLLRQSAGRRANAASKASRRTATSSGRGRSTSY